MNVTRRQFSRVCAAGLGGSSIAMMGFSPTAALAEVRAFKLARATETRNTCPYCSVSCGVLIYTTGDKSKNAHGSISHIEGDPDNPKTHAPSSFGAGSSTGFFTITPRNIGTQPTIGTVTVVDTLPAGMTLAAAATGSGWICVGAVGATTITCTTANVIAANASASPITVRVLVDASRNGQILTNTAVVSGGGEPPGFDSNNTATDPVVVSSTAQLSGRVWLDLDHDRRVDAGEPLQAGWTVELLLNGTLVASTSTSVSGQYAFAGLAPGSGYQVRFRHPTTGLIWGSAVPNEQGLTPVSGVRDTGPSTVNAGVVTAGNPGGAAVTGDGTLNNLTLLAGDNIVVQSLPIDPAGVVYDALTRTPVGVLVMRPATNATKSERTSCACRTQGLAFGIMPINLNTEPGRLRLAPQGMHSTGTL